MTIKNLHIFDFDGTLFRSPERPDWWKDKGWWGKFESLSPPCVPERPGSDWWVSSTVDAAKKSIADPETYVVLATGRLAGRFHKRMFELLSQAGLRFDEVHLTPGGGTLPFKLGLMEKLIEKLQVEKVEVWEDRSEHVGAFESVIKQFGKESEIHLVSTKPHPLECTAETMNPEAPKVARRFQSELLTKGWLMGVRRGWLHLLTVKPHGWPAIFKAFDAAREFVDNLEEQVLYERRTPSYSGPTALIDPKIKEAFDKLKNAIAEKRQAARHWFEVDTQGPDWMGRGSFPKEQGEQMRGRYEEHWGEMLTTYVRTKANPGKGTYLREREAPITELIDKLMELLRADVVKRDKAIHLEEEVVGPEGVSPTKEVFQDAAFKEFEYGHMKVVVTDPKGNGNLIRPYIRILDIAHQLMVRRGFGNLWYGVMFLQSTDYHHLDADELRAYESAGYKNLQNTAGMFHSGADEVVITAPANDRLVLTICHEMGHRYWYKHMTRESRLRFEDLVKVDSAKKSVSKDAKRNVQGAIDAFEKKAEMVTFAFETAYDKVRPKYGETANAEALQTFIKEQTPSVSMLGFNGGASRYSLPIYSALNALGSDENGNPVTGLKAVLDEYYDKGWTPLKEFFENSLSWVADRLKWPNADPDKIVGQWLEDAKTMVFVTHDIAANRAESEIITLVTKVPGDTREVLPVSDYGRTNIVEAFAEVFSYYCVGVDLDRDQLESFKSVLSSTSERVATEFRRLTGKPPVHRMTPMVHNH